MDVPWYERQDQREQLIAFGLAMQKVPPYLVVIEPDAHKCRSAYCSFTRRAIAVNPTFFSVPDDEQFRLTKALLIHEAGHQRFTVPDPLPSPAREVANILEDERVDRRMCDEFAAVPAIMHRLARQFYEKSRPIDESSDSPGEVVTYVLQLRWALRIGQPIKGSLSAGNRPLLDKIAPLVYESWKAESSAIVGDNAMRIVAALGLDEKTMKPFTQEVK